MTRHLLLAAAFVCAALPLPAKDTKEYVLHEWKKIQLTDKFWSEGAAFGDFNKDGKMDVVSGPYWYEGPDYTVRHEFYPAKQSFKIKKEDGSEQTVEGFEGGLGTNNTYSDNFFAFVHDFNHDGWPDVLIYGFPGLDASWYENPGKAGINSTNSWARHKVLDVVDNESPAFTDITGDGVPDIVCSSKGFYGYASPDASDPARPWTFHPVSAKGNWQRFTHGLGVGDVNGDGKMDLLEKDGWWEQPASLAGDPVWKKHDFPFAPNDGSAQMFVYDVNGDGLNDVITSLAAHGYGLAWYEQIKTNGEISFKKHLIMGNKPEQNRYGVKFSQLHALDLVDMNGDGLKDIVLGKRFWAHGNHGDADPNDPAVIYWFELVRDGRKVDWVPHLIDSNSGVGTQVLAAPASNKEYPDIVVGNKKGTFVHVHTVRKVTQERWEKDQPKVLFPDANKSE